MNASIPTLDSDRELQALRDVAWPGGSAGHARVEAGLMNAHARMASGSSARRGLVGLIQRHRLTAAVVGIAVLAGGAIAGSYYFNRLYSITISDDQGNVLSAPKILVAPGQKASITIGDSNNPDNMLKVEIDEHGNVISNRDDVNVDVEVQDVEADKPIDK